MAELHPDQSPREHTWLRCDNCEQEISEGLVDPGFHHNCRGGGGGVWRRVRAALTPRPTSEVKP